MQLMQEDAVDRIRGLSDMRAAAGCQSLAEAADSILDGLLSRWISTPSTVTQGSLLLPSAARTVTAVSSKVDHAVLTKVSSMTEQASGTRVRCTGTQPYRSQPHTGIRKLGSTGNTRSSKSSDQQQNWTPDIGQWQATIACGVDSCDSQPGAIRSNTCSGDTDSVHPSNAVVAPPLGIKAATSGAARYIRVQSWPTTGPLSVLGVPAANNSKASAVDNSRRATAHDKLELSIRRTPAPAAQCPSSCSSAVSPQASFKSPTRHTLQDTSNSISSTATRAQRGKNAVAPALAPLACDHSLDPAAWLPQQHPAVVAALQKDLLALEQAQAQQLNNSTGSTCDASSTKQSVAAIAVTASRGKQATIQQQRPIRLLMPQFASTAPTLKFTAASRDGFKLFTAQPTVANGSSSRLRFENGKQQQQQGAETLQLTNLKPLVKYYGVANNAVKQVFKESGFKRTKGNAWNVLWGSLAPPEMLADSTPFQKHNHFPGTWELGRKDRLYLNIASAARRTRGKAFTFVPKFFILPGDADDFKLDLAQHPTATYIRKPAASSRGRGVRLVQDPRSLDLASLKDVILQRYISEPLLIGGRKFDLRVYVAVTCLDPLRVYVYREGLVRFASEQYSTERTSLKNATMHLTNYSINKTAKTSQQPSSSSAATVSSAQPQQSCPQDPINTTDLVHDSAGESGATGQQQHSAGEEVPAAGCCKWSFGQLAAYFESQGHDWPHVWDQVCKICVQTVIATEPALLSITRSTGGPSLMKSCFEVFGFDIMLDQKLQAWLLEVNTCPALNADSPLDQAVKTNMVADLLGLVGVTPYDREIYQQQQLLEKQRRLTGLPANSAQHKRPAANAVASHAGKAGQLQCLEQRQVGSVRAAAAAVTTAAAVKRIRDTQQVDLLSIAPEQLPAAIRETQAEWVRCCRQQRRWQRLFPVEDIAQMKEMMGLFETSRLSNATVLRYYQQMKQQQGV